MYIDYSTVQINPFSSLLLAKDTVGGVTDVEKKVH